MSAERGGSASGLKPILPLKLMHLLKDGGSNKDGAKSTPFLLAQVQSSSGLATHFTTSLTPRAARDLCYAG